MKLRLILVFTLLFCCFHLFHFHRRCHACGGCGAASVQSFAVQAFSVPVTYQTFSVPVETYAVQAYAVPVQTFSTFSVASPVIVRERAFVPHRQREVIRSRTVVRRF